jgi:choline dehydrogenase
MHDYVIVGAGSAGCVLANRLSEDPNVQVLLLEAGGSDRTLLIRAPGTYQLLWRTKYDWEFYTEPQQHVDGRRMYWPRGKVLGGTSCLNAMVYMRGHPDNYDEWAALGNDGWSYREVLPYFKRSEHQGRGPSRYHGASGELDVCDQSGVSAISDAFSEAVARATGEPLTDDFNGATQGGAGRFQVTCVNGRRASASFAFLEPALKRKNLEVVSHATVTGLVLEGRRVTGVRYVKKGREQLARAGREIVLAAGAIGSPHLLLVSGIGPADELKQAGVTVVHDLPGVGKNLQDHLLTGASYEDVRGSTLAVTPLNIARWLALYTVGRGQLRVAPVEAGAFVRLRSGAPRPDLQFHFAPWGGVIPNTDVHRDPPVGRLFAIYPSLIYPKSVGEIRLKTRDPLAPPAIDPRYFSDSDDLDVLVQGVRLSREIAATEPLKGYTGREVWPGADHKSDDALRAQIRASVNTIFHPVGTCKMGVDDDAVVGPDLSVRGLEGLRVADASIMPRIIGGNTNAPTIMIAEKAADILRGRRLDPEIVA